MAAPVVEIGNMPVPAGHLMVRMRLADGREVLASPGHRTADGRPLGTLAQRLVVFGRVPFFFYLLHLPLIGLCAGEVAQRSFDDQHGEAMDGRPGEILRAVSSFRR